MISIREKALALGALLLVATGCGGGHSSSSATTTPAAPPALSVGTVGTAGSVLVDGQGQTLYIDVDERSNPDACASECISAWPPLLAASATPVLHQGVTPSLVGTRSLADGRSVVTYAGYPLHTYAGDDQAGQDNGEGVQGVWYTITVSGKPTRSGS
jgi:predicted lipoprotein with Yx(FWY)xxD motif